MKRDKLTTKTDKDLFPLACHEAAHAAASAILDGLSGITELELYDYGAGFLCGAGLPSSSPVRHMAGAWAEARCKNTAFDFLTQCEADNNLFGLDWDHVIEAVPEGVSQKTWLREIEQQTEELLAPAWPVIIKCAALLLAATRDKDGRRALTVEELRKVFAPIMLKRGGIQNLSSDTERS